MKKESMMPENVFSGSLDQISDSGRKILKSIEEYKFKIDQVSKIVKTNPQIFNMLKSKEKSLEQASQQIYSIVFAVENIDITEDYKEGEENGEKDIEVNRDQDPTGMPDSLKITENKPST